MENSFDEYELDKMRNDPTNYFLGVFYFNSKDYRVILPKRNQFLGWTLNFAKMQTYLILILFIAMIYLFTRL